MNVTLTSKEELIKNENLMQEMHDAEEDEEEKDGNDDKAWDDGYGDEDFAAMGGDMNQNNKSIMRDYAEAGD